MEDRATVEPELFTPPAEDLRPSIPHLKYQGRAGACSCAFTFGSSQHKRMLCTEICSVADMSTPSQLGRAVNNSGPFTDMDGRKRNDAAHAFNTATHGLAKLMQVDDPKGLIEFAASAGQGRGSSKPATALEIAKEKHREVKQRQVQAHGTPISSRVTRRRSSEEAAGAGALQAEAAAAAAAVKAAMGPCAYIEMGKADVAEMKGLKPIQRRPTMSKYARPECKITKGQMEGALGETVRVCVRVCVLCARVVFLTTHPHIRR